jgi:hypothetical protein
MIACVFDQIFSISLTQSSKKTCMYAGFCLIKVQVRQCERTLKTSSMPVCVGKLMGEAGHDGQPVSR